MQVLWHPVWLIKRLYQNWLEIDWREFALGWDLSWWCCWRDFELSHSADPLSFLIDWPAMESHSYLYLSLSAAPWSTKCVSWIMSLEAGMVASFWAICLRFLGSFCFPGGASGKDLLANAGHVRDSGSVPGLGGSPGEGHGNPLQYSCLENPMDRGVCWATVHSLAKSQTQLKRFNIAFKHMNPFFEDTHSTVCLEVAPEAG